MPHSTPLRSDMLALNSQAQLLDGASMWHKICRWARHSRLHACLPACPPACPPARPLFHLTLTRPFMYPPRADMQPVSCPAPPPLRDLSLRDMSMESMDGLRLISVRDAEEAGSGVGLGDGAAGSSRHQA